MKTVKKILGILGFAFIMISFSNCSTAQKFEKKAPTQFGEIYAQKWVSGVSGGASGTNLFVETLSNDIVLDSVYFRGKAAKFEVKPGNKQLYIGRFLTDNKEKQDFIISSNVNQEYSNKAPIVPQVIPFELEPNECVVSYLSNGKTRYYKLENIEERIPLDIPMTPKSDNN